MVVKCILLLTTNSANTSYSGQSFCLWSLKNQRYCSNSWFIHSICSSVWGWNDINSFVSISNIRFNSLIISTANWGPPSNTILSRNPCNFYMLSLNSLANFSTNVFSIVATKYIILDNLLQTTRTAFFLATNSNFVMKSTVR